MANDQAKVIRSRIARHWRDEDGTIRQVYDDGAVVNGEDAGRHLEVFRELGGGAPIRLLADIRGIKGATRESREAGGTPEFCETLDRAALIVGSPASRVIGNFFMRFSKPPYPTRLFTDEEEARRWLSTGP